MSGNTGGWQDKAEKADSVQECRSAMRGRNQERVR